MPIIFGNMMNYSTTTSAHATVSQVRNILLG